MHKYKKIDIYFLNKLKEPKYVFFQRTKPIR